MSPTLSLSTVLCPIGKHGATVVAGHGNLFFSVFAFEFGFGSKQVLRVSELGESLPRAHLLGND